MCILFHVVYRDKQISVETPHNQRAQPGKQSPKHAVTSTSVGVEMFSQPFATYTVGMYLSIIIAAGSAFTKS